jgi:hypothetical protein
VAHDDDPAQRGEDARKLVRKITKPGRDPLWLKALFRALPLLLWGGIVLAAWVARGVVSARRTSAVERSRRDTPSP